MTRLLIRRGQRHLTVKGTTESDGHTEDGERQRRRNGEEAGEGTVAKTRQLTLRQLLGRHLNARTTITRRGRTRRLPVRSRRGAPPIAARQ